MISNWIKPFGLNGLYKKIQRFIELVLISMTKVNEIVPLYRPTSDIWQMEVVEAFRKTLMSLPVTVI